MEPWNTMEPWGTAGQCCRFASLLTGIRIRIKKPDCASYQSENLDSDLYRSEMSDQDSIRIKVMRRSGFDPHQSYANLQKESRLDLSFVIFSKLMFESHYLPQDLKFSEGDRGIAGTQQEETHLKNSMGSSLLPDLRRSSRLPSKVLSTGNSAHLKIGHKII
jgi:hypothetical protein